MEYVPLGDLERNVAAYSGKISEIGARDIKQILSGLKIIHAESFAHRDLKPQVISSITAVFQRFIC
jgi:calcium/calmodulin-dependent protein kinase I